jgi:hypothetical protein
MEKSDSSADDDCLKVDMTKNISRRSLPESISVFNVACWTQQNTSKGNDAQLLIVKMTNCEKFDDFLTLSIDKKAKNIRKY